MSYRIIHNPSILQHHLASAHCISYDYQELVSTSRQIHTALVARKTKDTLDRTLPILSGSTALKKNTIIAMSTELSATTCFGTVSFVGSHTCVNQTNHSLLCLIGCGYKSSHSLFVILRILLQDVNGKWRKIESIKVFVWIQSGKTSKYNNLRANKSTYLMRGKIVLPTPQPASNTTFVFCKFGFLSSDSVRTAEAVGGCALVTSLLLEVVVVILVVLLKVCACKNAAVPIGISISSHASPLFFLLPFAPLRQVPSRSILKGFRS